jgi:hypothetical protein
MTLAHALVYVIDDDLSMRKAIGRLLESADYRVELLTGGARVSCSGSPYRSLMRHSRFEHARIKWSRTSRGAGGKGARRAGHFHYRRC